MDVEVLGPLAFRKFILQRVCESFEGHSHNYDHVTMVVHGRIRVSYSWMDGDKKITGPDREFGVGEDILIKANVFHTIKALEPNTIYRCVFSHRDFDGLVSQSYVGNDLAYV